MRISAKGRYALAATIDLARNYSSSEYIPVNRISEKLNISKIYLEQVFSLLKRGNLVTSVKGSQGGYKLKKSPVEITIFEILLSIEVSLFEETKESTENKVPEIEKSLEKIVFTPLDEAVRLQLESITLATLVDEVNRQSDDTNYMFYI